MIYFLFHEKQIVIWFFGLDLKKKKCLLCSKLISTDILHSSYWCWYSEKSFLYSQFDVFHILQHKDFSLLNYLIEIRCYFLIALTTKYFCADHKKCFLVSFVPITNKITILVCFFFFHLFLFSIQSYLLLTIYSPLSFLCNIASQ